MLASHRPTPVWLCPASVPAKTALTVVSVAETQDIHLQKRVRQTPRASAMLEYVLACVVFVFFTSFFLFFSAKKVDATE